MGRHLLTALLLGWFSGCIAGDETTPGFQDADFGLFVTEIQPLISESCANPSCHGDAKRPWQTFAVHQHRLDPADVFIDNPLSERELWLNYTRTIAFVGPTDEPLLRKPLAPTKGGSDHVGGVQFESTDEYDYQVLQAWIETVGTVDIADTQEVSQP